MYQEVDALFYTIQDKWIDHYGEPMPDLIACYVSTILEELSSYSVNVTVMDILSSGILHIFIKKPEDEEFNNAILIDLYRTTIGCFDRNFRISNKFADFTDEEDNVQVVMGVVEPMVEQFADHANLKKKANP